ncbi:hypothetical protein JCM5350_003955 [Sporobolomyces pararoseus]
MATAIQPINLIPLLKLASISNSPTSSLNSPPLFFQGYLISRPLYDPSSDSCILTLVAPKPNRAMAVVEVKGKAGIRIKDKLREKDKVCLSLKGATLKEMEHNQLTSVGIVFEEEIEGWIQRKSKKDEWFSSGNDSTLSNEPKSFENSQAEFPQNSLPTPPRQALSPRSSPNTIRNLSVDASPTKQKRLYDEDSSFGPLETRPAKRLNLDPAQRRAITLQAPEPRPVASTLNALPPKRKEESINFANMESKRASTQIPTFPVAQKPLLPLTQLSRPLSAPKLLSMPPPTKTREPPISVVPGTYAKLSDIKSGRDFVLNTSSFAVVVVEIGKVNKPRRPNDQTQKEIKRDSLESIIELQWYSMKLEDMPKFKQKDVLLLRSIYITDHNPTSLRCIRRSNRGTPPPYLSIPSSTFLSSSSSSSSSRQTEFSPLQFNDSKGVKLNQTEWELAKKLVNCYSEKWFPPEGSSFAELRSCALKNSYVKPR